MTVYLTQYDAFNADSSLSGMWDTAKATGVYWPVYQQMLNDATDPNTNGPVAGFPPDLWIWLQGAVQVNSDSGFFSDFIRNYTKEQAVLRGITPVPSNEDMQAISDTIAKNVLTRIMSNLPVTIESIGQDDGNAFVQSVFGTTTGLAPWSGTILYLMMGDNTFFNDTIIGSPGVYNMLALIESASYALGNTAGTASVSSLFDATITAFQAGFYNSAGPLETGSMLIAAGTEITGRLQDYYGASAANILTKRFILDNANPALSHDLFGAATDDLILGVASNSVIHGSLGNDILDGGTNFGQRIDYSSFTTPLTLAIDASNFTLALGRYLTVTKFDNASNVIGTDLVFETHNVVLGSGNDVITVKGALATLNLTIDAGGGSNTLDFSANTQGEYIKALANGDIKVFKDANLTLDINLTIQNVHNFVVPNQANLHNTLNLEGDTSGIPDTVTTSAGDNTVYASGLSSLDLTSTGGFTTLELANNYLSYQITNTGNGFNLTNAAGASDDVTGVQDFIFSDRFVTAAELTTQNATMNLEAFSQEVSLGDIYSPITTSFVGANSIFFEDTVAGLADTLSVEHFGDLPAVGTLTATLNTNADIFDVNGKPENNSGEISLAYTLDQTALLTAPKYIFNEDYTILISDGNGNTVISDVILAVKGLGETTSITSTSQLSNIVEDTSILNGAQTSTATIDFTDTDPADRHIAEVKYLGGQELGSLEATITQDTTGTGSGGVVNLEYSVDEATIQGLRFGETDTETYQITIDDGMGGTVTENVPITITARPNETSITSGNSPIAQLHQNATASGTETASGVIDFSDGDTRDVHLVSATLISTNATGGVDPGSLQVSLATDTLGTGTGGTIDWTYSVSDSAIVNLTFGHGVLESYFIKIDDGRGGIETVPLTVSIFGTATPPPGPVIAGNPAVPETGTIVADASAPNPNDSASGHINFSDTSPSDVHTASFQLDPTANSLFSQGTFSTVVDQDTSATVATGDVTWAYNISDAALSVLQDGQTLTGAYTVVINDGNGNTASQIVDISLTRLADQTTINGGVATGTLTAVANDTSIEITTGTITFADSDKVDVHTLAAPVFISSDGGSTPIGALQTSLLTDTTSSGNGGLVNWTYGASDAALYALAQNQTIHETWAFSVSDGHGGTTTQDVIISLTGPAYHAPVITSTAPALNVSEIANATGSAATDQQTTTVTFTDVDPNSLPTASIGSISAVYTDAHGNVQTLTSTALTSLENALTLTAASGNTNNGSETLSYSIANNALDFLGQGQTVVLTASVIVNDNNGDTASTPVTITLNGIENPPIAGAIQTVSTTENSSPITINLLSTASDVDPNAILSLATGSVTISSSDGHTVAFAAQNNAVTIDPSQFAYLGAGQQITLAIAYGVTDGVATTYGTGSMTVTGINQAPIITSNSGVPETGSITEGTSATETANGNITFSDVNLTDIHTVSAAILPNSNTIVAEGTLTATVTGDTTGNGTGGDIAWTYSISDSALASLGVGQTATGVYAVTLNDGNGGTAVQDVDITITGQNNTPVATAITSPAATDRSAPVIVNLLSTASDPDAYDTLSVVPGSLVLTSSDGHAVTSTVTGNVLTINPAQFEYLTSGQSITLDYSYNITNGGVVVSNTGSLQVNYVADHAPTISPINAGSVTQNAAIQQINLLTGAADVDTSDTVSVVPSSLVLTASDHHTVVGTLTNGVLTINPSQFNYLHLGQSDTITASYNITDGTDVVANTATMIVTGLNDAPVVPTTTLNAMFAGSSSFNTVFNADTGVTDPDTGASTSLVSGSETATSSDGHTVVVTDSGGYITLNSTQFKYLPEGQTTTVTIDFKIASSLSGAPQGQGTAIVTVVGQDDPPTTAATTTINQSNTSAYTIFPEETGFLLATPVNAGIPISYSIGAGGSTVFPTLLLTDNFGFYTVNANGEYLYFPNSAKINSLSSGTVGDNISVIADMTVGETVGTTITMNYTGAYEAPTNITWYVGGSLVENATNGNGFNLGTLTDTDIDNLSKTWTLVNNDGGAFALNSSSDTITIANSSLVSYANNPNGFDIIVKETDSDGLYVQQTVHIGWSTGGSGGGGSGSGSGTIYATPNEKITEMTTGVFDYTGSSSGVFIDFISPFSGYIGYGGSADGDTILVGDNQNQTSPTSYTFNLPAYNSIIKLEYWTTATVNVGGADDTIIGDDTHFSATYHTVYDIYGGSGFDTIHPGNDGYDYVSFGSGGGVLDYAGINSTYVVFNWADPGGTSTVHLYNTAGSTPVDAGITDVVGSFSTFNGTPSADTITGNNQNNTINGGGGYDTITDGNGNDIITAYAGVIHVGSGNDTIILNAEVGVTSTARSEVYAGTGNDIIIMTHSSNANVDIHAGTGNDTIDATWGYTGTVIYGAAGNDVLIGNSLVTVSYADATGPIAINGQTGTLGAALGNLIIGPYGNGTPMIQGSNYGDTFTNTNDTLYLGNGNNTVINNTANVYDGTGNDIIINNKGNVFGGTGNDTISATAPYVIHTGGGDDIVNSAPNSSTQIYFDHPTGVPSAAQLNYGYGDGGDTIYTFLQGSDSINISRLAGYADPVVSISQASGNTDVHMTWYVTPPVQGQPLPSHVDADILLHSVLLTTFTQNHDYHVV